MIPNMLAEVEKCKADYPQAWTDAHTGNPRTEDFIRLLATRLHRIEPRFGLNGKRGNPLDISDDAINWIGEGPGHDPSTGLPVTVFDVIRGAGGPTPQPSWDRIDLAGPGAWVQPTTIAVPPPTLKPAYPDENTFWKAFQASMRTAYTDAGRTFPDPNDADAFRRFSRCGFDIGTGMNADAAAAKHISELRKDLGV
jgi:hypothetical protein